MRKFETLLLLSPELGTEARDALLANFSEIIEREHGAIINIDHWGMRDLAYPVRKMMRGYYVLFEYEGVNAIVAEFERNIRISDGVFKFITVRKDEKKTAPAVEAE